MVLITWISMISIRIDAGGCDEFVFSRKLLLIGSGKQIFLTMLA